MFRWEEQREQRFGKNLQFLRKKSYEVYVPSVSGFGCDSARDIVSVGYGDSGDGSRACGRLFARCLARRNLTLRRVRHRT